MVAAVTGGLALLALGTIAPMSAQAAVTCTPAETMTGAHNGAINVAGGQKLCMTNATQTGALTVDPNGSLSVRNSAHNEIKAAVTATGNLVATNIVGNHIAGALTCTGNEPAPNNIGLLGRNIVGGERFGQTCLDGNF
jgi:hypothetical protein